ncbi:hypothetical protein NP233_g10577 [Leucocoprinus birnbaumii]|uniref:GST N-terminal domain-containing protein n=1 Tax=Leucocoprinus birnbaumii TaxID=56174 RepID=A0AAD5VII2_9AGAR|nr:hypothetical protein NP233_g10577 [Leucocoprinus birnbaumii]
MITLFDLAAKAPIKCWSPYAWKARYVLNMKNIPYTTAWVDYPDLEPESKKAGVKPSNIKKRDGNPWYTCPAIVDDSTGTAIPDSFEIALYLDKQYPNTPRAIPEGMEGLQKAFEEQFMDLLQPTIWVLIVSKVPAFLNPSSAKYFYDTRSAFLGKPLEQLAVDPEERKQLWAKIKGSFDKLDGYYAKTDSAGPFFMGQTVSFADFTVAGMLRAVKICLGSDSEEWKAIEEWNGGRWKALIDSLEPYASEN